VLELGVRNEPPKGLGFDALEEGVDPSPKPPRDPKLRAVVSDASSSILSSWDKLISNFSSFSVLVLSTAADDGISG